MVLPDGRHVAYYAHHVGAALHWRVSTRPYDVTAWAPQQSLVTNVAGAWGDTYTYPNPVWLPAEKRAFLFWRGGNMLPDFSLGRTLSGQWTAARTLISVSNNQRPYVKVTDNGRDTILFAFTNANPREGISSLFFSEYRAGKLRHAEGRSIASLDRLPMPAWSADVLWDAHVHRERAWVWDVAFSRAGRPSSCSPPSATTSGNTPTTGTAGPARDGRITSWHRAAARSPPTLRSAGTREGSRATPRDPEVAYASSQVQGRFEIARFATHDGGKHWSREWITSHSRVDNVRPDVPEGLPAGRDEVVWMRGTYDTYKQFHTSIWTSGA